MTKHKSSVLVVGGAGYIGSHMVKDLVEAGHDVVCLDNFSTGHKDLAGNQRVIKGDLGDSKVLEDLFSARNIQAVMHFAAFSLVGESVEQPLKYYRNNVGQTIELLDAMIRHDVKTFIFSSSAAVYGEPLEVPIGENHPCKPTNPYGATKIAVEGLLQSCDHAYGLKYTALRYFNAAGADPSATIGERHDPETHLIPLVLKVATAQRDHINVFGTDYPTPDGTCIRDYVHVNDLTKAHLLALEALYEGEESVVYNLGSSTGYSVKEVVDVARKVTGHAIPAVDSDRRPGDPAVLIASSEKIRQALGWKPQYEDLNNIIQTAWAWHRKEAKP
jgi:UDP-glucose 4-epimerase